MRWKPPLLTRHTSASVMQVSQTCAAAAVIQDNTATHHPARELLFRDFCELIVRLSSQRYPQHATLEQQLQQVLSQHLMPLVANSAKAARRASTTASSTCMVAAAVGPVGGEMSGTGSPGALSEKVLQYLGQEVGRLQQLFELVAIPSPKQEDERNAQRQQHWGHAQGQGGTSAGIGAEVSGRPEAHTDESADMDPNDVAGEAKCAEFSMAANDGSSCMTSEAQPPLTSAMASAAGTGANGGVQSWEAIAYGSCCSTRSILAVWQQGQVLQGPLSSSSVGHAFLSGILATDDPQEPR
jgi:hypothetical protein